MPVNHLKALLQKASASKTGSRGDFSPGMLKNLPEPVRRYLLHAIEPGTPLAGIAELQMKGEIRLKGWNRFKARQVITADMELVWAASVRMTGLPVRGYDRLVDDCGEMRWKLLSLIPVMKASGRDVTRSAAGRAAAELVWLPSAFLLTQVELDAVDDRTISCSVEIAGEKVTTRMIIDDDGRLLSVSLRRWGNPDGKWGYSRFGGTALREKKFGGFTIPAEMRVGWHFDGNEFLKDGEFFRTVISDVNYL